MIKIKKHSPKSTHTPHHLNTHIVNHRLFNFGGINIVHIAFIILALYTLVMKVECWGIHFWHYIPLVFPLIYILLYLLISIKKFSGLSDSRVTKSDLFIGIGLAMAVCVTYYASSIQTDIYGDHRHILKTMASSKTSPTNDWFKLISANILTKSNGENTVLSIVKLIVYYTGISHLKAFQLLNLAAGCIFWTFAIKTIYTLFNTSKALFYTFLCIIATSGFTLFFHGYAEVYPLALATFTAFFYYLYKAITQKSKQHLIISFITLFFAIKSNSAGFLLIPGYLLALYNHTSKAALNTKKALLFAYLPTCCMGIFVFLFILRNIQGSQVINERSDALIKMFLPLISNHEPHSGYSLFSLMHLNDFLNILLFCSIGSFFMILYTLVIFLKTKLKSPVYSIFLVQFLLFISFYFMVNPLLSVIRDWDLYSLLAPSFLFLAIIGAKTGIKYFTPKICLTIAMISLSQIPLHVVNLNKDLLKNRMLDAGYYVYQTYWVGSSYILNVAANYDQNDTTQLINTRLKILNTLQPRIKYKEDQEYALLANNLGLIYLEQKKYNHAFKYFSLAIKYNPTERHFEYAAYSLYNQGNLKDAYTYLQPIINTTEKPSLIKLYIHIALQLEKYSKALEQCLIYNQKYPTDISLIPLTQELKNFRDRENK